MEKSARPRFLNTGTYWCDLCLCVTGGRTKAYQHAKDVHEYGRGAGAGAAPAPVPADGAEADDESDEGLLESAAAAADLHGGGLPDNEEGSEGGYSKDPGDGEPGDACGCDGPYSEDPNGGELQDDGGYSEEPEPSDVELLYLAGTPPRNLGGFSCGGSSESGSSSEGSGSSSDAGSDDRMVPFSRGRGCSPTPRSDRRRSRSRSPRGRGCNSSGAGHARSSPYGTPSCSPAARFGGGGRSLGGTPSCMGSGGTSPMAPSGGAAAAASGRGGAPAGVPRPRRGRREPNVAFYKQHLTTVVATNNTTLRQLLYGVLVTYVRDRLPRASVSSMLKLLKHTATAPDLIPTNPKTMLRILDVKDWSCFERHFCDGERCAGYVYDAAPRESWPGLPAQQRTCPKCQTPRFRTIYRGGREVLEPRAWFIDFGIKEVIASFFADPQFVAAWRQARVELRDAAETGAAEAGSWAAGSQFRKMRDVIGDTFLNIENINLTLLIDGVEPYNKVTHSTCVVGLVCQDLPADACVRINNVRTLAIIPGPKVPNNLKACLLPSLIELRRAAGDPPAWRDAGVPGFRGPAPLSLAAAEADGRRTPIKTIPYITGIMGDRMAQIKFSGVLGPSARISCHHCNLEGTPFANAGGQGVTYRPAGYDQPAPQNLNHGGTPMCCGDARLKVDHKRHLELTDEVAHALETVTSAEALRQVTARLGRKECCIMLDWLWYLDWNDTFIVPVVHALLHNVFGKFLTFALRQVAADTDAATVISREARKTLAARVDEVIPTADIGRTVKCPLKHLGLYTFEDFKNLALVYGNYLFADILPPTLEAMYNNLVTATQHYLTFGNFTAASRRAARDALLEYARAAERLGPVAACLLTPSLHILVCRLFDQEAARGEVAANAEYIVERLMQDIKRETSGKRVPSGVEKTVANQQLMHQRERQLLRDHHAELRTIEQLLDVEASAAARAERNDDCGPAGPQGARLVGRKRSPAREEKDRSLHPVLARLEDAGDGWTAGAAATALAAGRCAIYSRATLGPGAGVIFSEAYGRQRTRNTSHVKVRWVGLSGEDEPYICRVEHYLLLTPPPACVAARAAAGVAAGAAASAAAGPLSPLRLAVVASFKAAPCGPAMWRANADAPAEGGRLWPVRLAEIDCRLLMAAPSKCLSRGELYGIEYTTLSRVG